LYAGLLVDWLNAVDLRYRNELGERNGLNFAHFDERMEQRLAGVRAEFRTELQQLRREIQQVRTELYQVRLEMPGWLFGFWIAAVIGMAALAIALR
jgi:hypothetical protein